ncbi:MAG: carboxypeptidase regulatory-like domain-containing protein [Gemmatimonadota bacterium]
MRYLRSAACLLAGIAVVLWSAAAARAGDTAGTPPGTATVTGVVTLPASAPRAARPAGAAYSGVPTAHAHGSGPPSRGPHETVVVSLHPRSFAAPALPLAEPPRLEQAGMAFVPRVLPITVGSTVHIVNLDQVFHNVFSLTPGARFDIGHRRTGEVVPQRIDVPGRVEVFCDIHPDMVATILSLDTPYYARPDAAGRYEIRQLPPGTYEVRAFHPIYAFPTATLELKPGTSAALDFAPTE